MQKTTGTHDNQEPKKAHASQQRNKASTGIPNNYQS